MHFYEELENGEVAPLHLVPVAKDPRRLRPTRMSDYRKMTAEGRKLRVSVTEAMKVMSKDALVNWKIDQHLRTAFVDSVMVYASAREEDKDVRDEWGLDSILESIEERNEKSYISEIKRLTELELEKAPKSGTDFHKLMEEYLSGDFDTRDDKYDLCSDVHANLMKETGGGFLYSEYNFVSDDYGGQIDLYLNNQDGWVIDYKTKTDKWDTKLYDNHYMQLAAYRQAVAPEARCAIVFVHLNDEKVEFVEADEDQLKRGWGMFKCCLDLWYLKYGVER